MSGDIALLVIDVQKGLIEEMPQDMVEPFVTRVADVIAKAHTADVPVIYVQHSADHPDDSLHPDKPTWDIYSDIAPRAGEPVVHKRHPDSFQETDLSQQLESRGIKRLVITGMQTDQCVNATTRRAHDLGYDPILVSDAHATSDSDGQTAAQIIAQHNETLGNGFATLTPASEIAFDHQPVHA